MMNNIRTHIKTEIGLMPTDWKITSIGSEFDIQQGKQVSVKTRAGENQKPFLRTANLFWNRIDLSVLDKMNFNAAEELRMKIKVNDIFVCEGGDIGRTALVKNELGDIYYQNHLHRLRIKDNSTNPLFFVFWMMYCWQFTEYYSGAGNKTTIPNLSQSRLKALLFPKPEKSEQDAITDILSVIQSAIQKQEQIIKTTSELKNALMKKVFTEGVKKERLKETEIGLIPESWEVKKIGEIATDFLGGGTPSTSKEEYWKGKIHWTTSKRLNAEKIYLQDGEKRITKEAVENSSTNIVPKNNLIVSTRVTVGKVAINLIDIAISQDLTGVLIDENKYSKEFIAFQIQTEKIQNIFQAQKRGATIKGVTRDDLKDIQLSMPKTKIQQETVARPLLIIDKKITLHQTKQIILESLFQSSLHHLMTGSLRVKDSAFNLKKKLAQIENV